MVYLVRLLAEGAPLSEARLATRRLAQHLHAASALHYCLRVAEHRRDREASGALHVHEERVGRLYKPLQLVLLGLDRGVGVKQVTLQSRHREDYLLAAVHTSNRDGAKAVDTEGTE